MVVKVRTRKRRPEPLQAYFAYGSNLHMEQMAARCRDSAPVDRATLPGHRLTFRRVADIVPAEGHEVSGAVYMVSAQDTKALDRYEGYPHLYTRRMVLVRLGDGRIIEAFVYVMKPSYRFEPPGYYYLRTIVEGYLHWGLDIGPLHEAITHSKKKGGAQRVG